MDYLSTTKLDRPATRGPFEDGAIVTLGRGPAAEWARS